MSIVTFWSNGKEETGKTMSIAAISTYMAIEHNYKILVISTTDKSDSIANCFWSRQKKKTNASLYGVKQGIDTQTGMSGLIRIARSNKITPEVISNYTKVVFKDTLEILLSGNTTGEDLSGFYPEIIDLANQYYDLVFVDLDSNIDEAIERKILNSSNLVVANLSQRLKSIDIFKQIRQENELFKSPKTLILVGRYDKFSKYTSKNISRYIGERNEVLTIPYNTLFFEAAEEAGVPDLFLKVRKIDKEDRNYLFAQEVKRAAENIQYRLQDLQMRM